MRAREFVTDNNMNEIAPIIAALGSTLARGAISGAVNLGKQAIEKTVNKQTPASTITPTPPTKTPAVNTLTTSTASLPSPNDLVKLKGRSVPTDLGQLKIGNTVSQGLELEIPQNNKLSNILGNKITLPLK